MREILAKKIGPAVRFRSLSFKLYSLLVILLIVSFAGIMYFNLNSYTEHINDSIINSAIQASNLIRRSTRHTMLTNDRENLSNIITSIGMEEGMEGVRIYNKPGKIAFSSTLAEIGAAAEKEAEQCFVCHGAEPAPTSLRARDRIRILTSPQGYRILGLVTPIENEPDCHNASCHAHSSKDKLLGLLDVKLSLKAVDEETYRTRKGMVLFSSVMIAITALLFAGFIMRLVHAPIKALSKGTREVAKLNLDYSIKCISRDEMGELAESFNFMTQQLKAANKVNQEWSATLERRIKEKSEELKKAQAHMILVEKIVSLGKLAAVVAHEINNPLSGILTYATLCLKLLQKRALSPEENESVTRYLTVIKDETRRCGEIVKNLLIFARRDFGKWGEESLHRIIHSSIQLVQHNFEMKEIQLVTELAEGTDLIYCDVSGIRHIFVGLFMNALEAMAKGGTLKVKTTLLNGGHDFQIVISDTGCGIPPEILPHIFEPFFSTKESSGLGLSVVYRIVEQHGGKIDVVSKPNEGASFVINLPRGPLLNKVQLRSDPPSTRALQEKADG